MFVFTDSRSMVSLAFTDRHDGVSSGAWESLNLGTSNGDDPDRVRRNHELVAEGLDVDPAAVVRMSQIHGDEVHLTTGATDHIPVADALVTTTPGVALLVRAADCVPVVLADPHAGVVGVAHAGREGVVRSVVPATVAAMRSQGATALIAWLGPRVCGRCYEVPAALRDRVSGVVPQAAVETSWGTPGLDIGAGVRAQLSDLDVPVVDVAEALGRVASCTRENDDLFSYRRQGQQSGRIGGIVVLRAAG